MKACDANVANPFLDAIGPSLVEGFVLRYIIGNLLIGENLESHFRRHIEATFLLGSE